MRKYSLLALAVALLFAMGMMAQTSSGSSSSSSPYPSSSDQSGMQSGQSGTADDTQTGTAGSSGAYGAQSGSSQSEPGNAGTERGNPTNRQPGMGTAPQNSTGGMGGEPATGSVSSQTGNSGTTSANARGKEKTVEGCVVRRETDFYIFPKNGKAERISSSGQSVSEHLGHQVKLHGTEQPSTSPSASATMGGTSGTAGTSASARTGENAEGTSGSVGANTGSGTAGAASSGANNKEFVVDRVDMVSETCPANIQGKATAGGMSTSPQ